MKKNYLFLCIFSASYIIGSEKVKIKLESFSTIPTVTSGPVSPEQSPNDYLIQAKKQQEARPKVCSLRRKYNNLEERIELSPCAFTILGLRPDTCSILAAFEAQKCLLKKFKHKEELKGRIKEAFITVAHIISRRNNTNTHASRKKRHYLPPINTSDSKIWKP